MSTTTAAYTTVSAESLRALGLAVLAQVGVPAADAAVTIDSLVEADLRGVHSHGMILLPGYVTRLRRGGSNPRPNVRVVTETGGIAVVDGDNGLGQVVSKRAMETAIARARATGIGIVGARNTSHFGTCAYWAQMALDHDMVGIAMTNGVPIMPPWGGLTPSLGNDPIGVAIPAGEELPIVLDMATSVVAAGKITIARRKGEKIPLGWAVNQRGEPTEDPNEAQDGMVLPAGGYKGYGLTVVFEVLAGVLMGARFARQVAGRPLDPSQPLGIGHSFQAIDIAPFMPVAEFKAKVDELIRQLKASEVAPGFNRVYLPGEPEHEHRARRLKEGIPMITNVLEELETLADSLGVRGVTLA